MQVESVIVSGTATYLWYAHGCTSIQHLDLCSLVESVGKMKENSGSVLLLSICSSWRNLYWGSRSGIFVTKKGILLLRDLKQVGKDVYYLLDCLT